MVTAELKIYLRIGNSRTAVREPPHVALANLRESPDAVAQFTRRWERLAPPGGWDMLDEWWIKCRDALREAWRTDKSPVSELPDNTGMMVTSFEIKKRRIEFRTQNLWSIIVLLFLRDRAARKTAICANEDCPNPYF